MNTTAKKQRKVLMPFGIRKKFAAAIAMLLIASLMMVSSTYAWFTLSTAPEVTGITTNVGANGNLEIALLNDTSFYASQDDLGIQSAVGDSMENKAVTEANETWGNLVDLSDESYGLTKMILNPAALNFASTEGKGITGGLNTLLLAPTYGSDGRVINVQKLTQTGKYDGTRFNEGTDIGGVRVVGVSSGITLRISSYRNARAAITTYRAAAKNAATRSLVAHGQDLANLLMSYVAEGNTYVIKSEDKAALEAVLDDLGASLNSVADAIRMVALTYALSSANDADLSDDQVAAMVEDIKTADISAAGLQAVTGVDVSALLGTAIAKYTTTRANLDTAVSTVEGLTAGTSTYAQASNALDNLIKKENVKVANVQNPTSEDVSAIASAAISSGYIHIEMLSGSGIYADIAELVENYTASGLELSMEYNGMNVDHLPTSMSTSVTGTALLITAGTAAAAGEGAAGSGGTSIDDPYGYIIDFGVRTNAAGSNLLLDLEGSQRVYDDNTSNAATQGQGTYLEFTSADLEKFSLNDVEALMSAIRVVFLTPNSNGNGYDILGIGAPDIQVATDDATGAHTVTKGDTVTEIEAAGTVRANVLLWNYTVTELVTDKEYQLVLGAKKTAEDGSPDTKLTELVQNKAKKVSALVYLDGDIVDNTFVANAKTSMSGKLNVQFKSDATLQPMDVTSMREASDNGTTSSPGTSVVTHDQLSAMVSAVTASSIYTAAYEATDKTEIQTNLVNAVAAATAVPNDASVNTINIAAINLALAAQAAGITLP